MKLSIKFSLNAGIYLKRMVITLRVSFLPSPKDIFSLLLEREEGREEGGDRMRNTDVTEKH